MGRYVNKIITISGEPASGKSTVVAELIKEFEGRGFTVHKVTIGHLFRELAEKEYKKIHPEIENPNIADIQNDKSFAEHRNRIDGMLDNEVARRGRMINRKLRPDDIYIFDSRLAFHNIPESFSIRLTIDENLAGKRAFEDKKRGKEDRYTSVEEAIEKTRQRKLGEIERYKQRYGVDLADVNNYDLVIDTSNLTVEQEKNIVMCNFDKWCDKNKTIEMLHPAYSGTSGEVIL